ncbi:DNA cytosine methyltransferase [Paenibacillus polysaccharolyticus]|uniref:DNA cytosine methyltransferase n=2 Tax=Paenibacillus polysaccharolyticus TaxID=582692 RepID=UPI00300B77E9
MRKLSLFSGIGGIDLAAHWAGMETVAFCEREPFPVKVLQKNFPGVPIYDDVCTLTAERLKEDGLLGDGRTIDIISAGFPCQPFSHAGSRKGIDDERYLWPEVVRVVADIRPTWFVGENVAGLLSMAEPAGGTEVESRVIAREADEDFYEAVYTQQEIMLIGRICQDLKDIGYEVQVYVLPASSVGASHKRDRTFIVADTNDDMRRRQERTESRCVASEIRSNLGRKGDQERDANQRSSAIVGNPSNEGLQKWRQSGGTKGQEETGARLVTELERSGETLADTEINTQGRLSIGERTENTGSARNSENVAHAACKRCGETRGDQRRRPEKRTPGSGENVAHTCGTGCEELYFATVTTEQRHLTRCNDQIPVAHADSEPGLQTNSDSGAIRSSRESWDDACGCGGPQSTRTGGRSAQSGMGGNADEFPAGLDGSGIDSLDDLIDFIHSYPQPALMGIPQYDWEPPRVATGVQDRTGRLKALGNAVDPLQIYPFMVAIKAINDRL